VKKILIALALVSTPLSACAGFNPFVSPAPLTHSAVDEKTLIVALQTFDTLLTAVDKLIEVGVIKPGSPRAVQIADAIAKAKQAFQAADAARKAGSSQSYVAAFSDAQSAVAQISLLIKGS
jgi:hypothetical protein